MITKCREGIIFFTDSIDAVVTEEYEIAPIVITTMIADEEKDLYYWRTTKNKYGPQIKSNDRALLIRLLYSKKQSVQEILETYYKETEKKLLDKHLSDALKKWKDWVHICPTGYLGVQGPVAIPDPKGYAISTTNRSSFENVWVELSKQEFPTNIDPSTTSILGLLEQKYPSSCLTQDNTTKRKSPIDLIRESLCRIRSKNK